MNQPEISFSGSTLTVENRSWQVEYPIHQAFALKDKVFVLYDPDCKLDDKIGQFPNLIAFDFEGRKLWTAELPTNESQDCYYQITQKNGLTADSWKSFSCVIDRESGKIKGKTFYK